jgi:CO/xanthine dehydrogenase FAD-binding subunit
MINKVREYHRPAGTAEAAGLLQRDSAAVAPLAVGPRVPDTPLAGIAAVVDLSQLGLDYLRETDDGTLHLGAGLSLQALVDSVRLQSLAGGVVAEGALLDAGSAMRHAATVGGAVQYARQAAAGRADDGPPELLLALLVLGAEAVSLSGQGAQRVLDLGAYLAQGAPEGELLLELRFPTLAAGALAALARVARTPRDQAIVAAAALVGDGQVRLAVAAGGAAPQRVAGAEAALAGQPLTGERLEAAAREVESAVMPHSDFRGSAEYRRAMAGVVARRALGEAARRAAQAR